MKDFYDLWVLAQRFEFGSTTLAAAIRETFARRHTELPTSLPLALSADFYGPPTKQAQWRAFLRKSGLDANTSLQEVIQAVEKFVMPAVERIWTGHREEKLWQPGGPWKSPKK